MRKKMAIKIKKKKIMIVNKRFLVKGMAELNTFMSFLATSNRKRILGLEGKLKDAGIKYEPNFRLI